MSEEFSLVDLFRDEVKSHAATLGHGLIELEAAPGDARRIEPLMRAAHSIKGAARIVGLDAAVDLAHVLEDALVAAQHGQIVLTPADIDVLLRGSDLLAELGTASEAQMQAWGATHAAELAQMRERLRAMAEGRAGDVSPPSAPPLGGLTPPARQELVIPAEPIAPGDEHPMFDLFREEVRSSAVVLRDGLASAEQPLDDLLRAAQGLRGAARIVGLDAAAALASGMEASLAAAQQGQSPLDAGRIQILLDGTRLFVSLLNLAPEEAAAWLAAHRADLAAIIEALQASPPSTAIEPAPRAIQPAVEEPAPRPAPPAEQTEAVVRVTAQSLNRLMSLAGESLVQARWLQPFAMALLRLKKQHDQLAVLLDGVHDAATARRPEQLAGLLDETRRQAALCRQVLVERVGEFEDHAAQAEDLNSRLYREVIVSRMRPFADGAHGFPRLVRDMARQLGKQVRLEIEGLTTEVDRDVLEKLEAPLMHLLRNAVDHGVEAPDDRRAKGKDEQGVIRLEVLHLAGMLAITVRDDGGGLDLSRLRRKVVERGLTTAEMANSMSEAELLEFLFLPGFSTSHAVTEYSGRGVGLDVVQDTIRKVGGSVRVSTQPGRGTTFHLQLPITLSVLRAVLVDIAGEPYAFPHNRIDRLLRVPLASVRSLEHRQYVAVDGQNVGLVLAAQLLDLPPSSALGEDLPVVLLSDTTGQYGLIVDAFRGEQDLVVRPLDARLGKVPNVSAAAILDEGSPVLIADVEDLIRSMDHFIQSGTLRRYDVQSAVEKKRKRILVVDDSITVREVERQVLRHAGYDVDVAVDGRDGWNQARLGGYDLVVTDVDMPRMTGLDLVKAIRDHEPLRGVPIVIVSYKDREEDRLRGLELGANFYLTKSSFHDNRFLQVIKDLIGEA